MTDNPAWLPDLVTLKQYGGDWNRYVEVLYRFFCKDFVNSRPTLDSRPVNHKRLPLSDGKVATFWHIISEGRTEDDRVPDLRRCERIRWPRPTIESTDADEVKCWTNRRRGETRIVLWLEKQDYVVILADRRHYVLLWTAYYVDRNHTRRKLRKEYETYRKRLASPDSDDTVTPSTHGR